MNEFKITSALLSFVLCLWILEKMSVVLIPFVFALFAYFAILPVQKWFQSKLKIPPFFSALLTLIVSGSLTWVLVVLFAIAIIPAVSLFDAYTERIHLFLTQIEGQMAVWGWDISVFTANDFRNLPIVTWVKSITGGVFGFVGNLALVFVYILFLIFGSTTTKSTSAFLDTVQTHITKYVLGKTFFSILNGLMVWGVLALLGVDFAFLFGLMAYVLNFIPNIGGALTTALPIPVVLLNDGIGMKLMLVIALPTILNFLMGNIIETRFMGDLLDLHPVTVLVALIFWGSVWGVTGMFLAAPLTSIIKIALERTKNYTRLADLMAGRW